MSDSEPVRVTRMGTAQDDMPDLAYIVFASPEPRCLGAATLFSGYRARSVVVLQIGDEENKERARNIARLRELCGPVGDVHIVPMMHSDPVLGIDQVLAAIPEGTGAAAVSIDISTFPRNALLLLLRALLSVHPAPKLRVIYTEPRTYEVALNRPVSYGLCRIAVIPTFSAPYRAEEELVLVMFLGFERDRVLGVWQSVAPHRTLAVIGDPPYRPEWRGFCEHINAAILAGLPEENVFLVDPRNPVATFELLTRLLVASNAEPKYNYYVAPFGTKPQTVGLACFCQMYPQMVNVVYAAPVERNQDYITQGMGATWILPLPY